MVRPLSHLILLFLRSIPSSHLISQYIYLPQAESPNPLARASPSSFHFSPLTLHSLSTSTSPSPSPFCFSLPISGSRHMLVVMVGIAAKEQPDDPLDSRAQSSPLGTRCSATKHRAPGHASVNLIQEPPELLPWLPTSRFPGVAAELPAGRSYYFQHY